jgi:hypothetical protein
MVIIRGGIVNDFLLKIILCLIVSFFLNLPGYCLYRDNIDYEEAKEQIEQQRRTSREKLKINQEQERLEKNTTVSVQESIPGNLEEEAEKTKSRKIIFVFVALFAVISGYIFYRRSKN